MLTQLGDITDANADYLMEVGVINSDGGIVAKRYYQRTNYYYSMFTELCDWFRFRLDENLRYNDCINLIRDGKTTHRGRVVVNPLGGNFEDQYEAIRQEKDEKSRQRKSRGRITF